MGRLLRLFFALPLPERLSLRLEEEVARLRALPGPASWVPGDHYHVTLKFLGEVDEDGLLAAHAVADSVMRARPPLRLVAKGLGGFPDPASPRVVVCGVEGESEEDASRLASLHGDLEARLLQEGWRRDKGSYSPHVTLGRVRDPELAREVGEKIGPGRRREFGHFVAREVVLFESRKGREETHYLPLRRYPLAP